jgi:hypothetical protein
MDKDRGTIWEQDRSKRNAKQINRMDKHEWTTQRHRLHWEQDRTKRNTKQITRMDKHEWTTQRHRLHWEEDRKREIPNK